MNEDPRCSLDNLMFERVEQPGVGSYLMPGSPLDFASHARVPVCPAPRLGEHTEQVFAELLGLSPREIGRLQESGVVGGAAPAGAPSA